MTRLAARPMSLRLQLAVATTGAVAVGWLPLAGALAASPIVHRHTVSEVENIAMVGLHANGTAFPTQIYAGTIDGTIDRRPIHGARRAVVRTLKLGDEIVRGTEFDAGGSRSFVIHNHYTILPGLRTISRGVGKWTGGTGAYPRARGSFTVTVAGKIGSVATIHLAGEIGY